MKIWSRREVFKVAGLLSAIVLLPFANAFAADNTTAIKIGTIGAGNLGGAVGALWVKSGHEVLFSSRDPQALKSLVDRLGPKAKSGSVDEAIAFGDVVLLAIPYEAYPQVGRDYSAALKGKIIIDAGNANRSSLYAETQEKGIGVTTAKYFPGARIVRAFNAANNRIFTDNAGKNPRIAIPIAGDDKEALEVVKSLITSAGFDPLVVGSLKDADKFAMGTSGFGHVQTAPELAKTLGLHK
ncbi:NADPH-dependent F420 reductase [Methylobacillus pratensis]|uniref:NADPH-dependent F420 reductase n=1 Tax=Methylobacillus sp. Pita1 TaxID=3382642 RepID=UPI0038B6568D